MIKTLSFENEKLILLDQRYLPQNVGYFTCETYLDVIFAIKDMVVRGAPAIGAAAAYGYYMAAVMYCEKSDFSEQLQVASEAIYNARPTAVNLMWAIKRMRQVSENHKDEDVQSQIKALREEAVSIHLEDIATNQMIANYGAELIKENSVMLTHCNTGSLATAGVGTALGVIKEAHKQGKIQRVYADETRPRFQGARLTAWELVQENIPACLITEGTAATLIRDGKIDCIIVGADRITLNGDTANKIGTFMLSALAKMYNVPFYIAAPTTTIDFDMVCGKDIEIEERDASEITHVGAEQIAPDGIPVFNPAFDVTPAEHISGIITEKGVIRPPYLTNLKALKETISK